MKTTMVTLLLLMLIGCSKEKDPLLGRWTLTEHFSYSSAQFQPLSRISFVLHEGGRFEVTQYDSTQFRSSLPNYNRYRQIDNETLLLFNTNNSEQEKLSFQLKDGLWLSPEFSRCPMFDVYSRY